MPFVRGHPTVTQWTPRNDCVCRSLSATMARHTWRVDKAPAKTHKNRNARLDALRSAVPNCLYSLRCELVEVANNKITAPPSVIFHWKALFSAQSSDNNISICQILGRSSGHFMMPGHRSHMLVYVTVMNGSEKGVTVYCCDIFPRSTMFYWEAEQLRILPRQPQPWCLWLSCYIRLGILSYVMIQLIR